MNAVEGKIPQVFVSHSHQDNDYCRDYVKGLRDQGLDVWYDEHDLGQGQLLQEIDRQLAVRNHFIVILSPDALLSTWVQLEIRAAIPLYMSQKIRTFLPIVAKSCAVDTSPVLGSYKRIEGPNGQPVAVADAVAHTLNVIHPPKYADLAAALQKQKDLDRLKDEFIHTITHEFRTPVTAIEGYVGLIERHAELLDRQKLERYALEIHQSAAQLAGMLTRIADVSMMDERELQLTTVPVNVRRWADQAIATLPLDASARVVADVPPDLWMLADGERLGQVFSNLLGNAIKYSPAYSPVRVTAWSETRDTLGRTSGHHNVGIERAPEQVIMVSVRDFGEGIPLDQMGKLFHKFVRLPRSLVSPVRGTGLGLWICKAYVEAMGGAIWVESEVGNGADFRFWLVPATVSAGPQS